VLAAEAVKAGIASELLLSPISLRIVSPFICPCVSEQDSHEVVDKFS